MKTIKLMADYGCFPLWNTSPSEVGNIDPGTLPLSGALRTDLLEWAKSYDQTLDLNDPLGSGFKSDQEEERFRQRGRMLGERLQAELGGEIKVVIKV